MICSLTTDEDMKRAVLIALAILTTHVVAGELPSIPEAAKSTIGFRSVAAALAALRAQHVMERKQQGWTIFEDPAHRTIWSFAPKANPAYPSAVRREMTEKDGAWYVNMSVQCEASKKACDQLVRDFQQLNQKMRQAIQSAHEGKAH